MICKLSTCISTRLQSRDDQVVVAPTLIKQLPQPLRRLIGDMMDKEKILRGLELQSM